MVIFEREHRHYPCIKREYVLQVDHKEYKLLNPYCFKNYLNDITKVYFNPDIRVSEKKKFFYKNRQNNVHELGCLVLSLIHPFDSQKLIEDVEYRKLAYKQIEGKISRQLKKLILYLFDGNFDK